MTVLSPLHCTAALLCLTSALRCAALSNTTTMVSQTISSLGNTSNPVSSTPNTVNTSTMETTGMSSYTGSMNTSMTSFSSPSLSSTASSNQSTTTVSSTVTATIAMAVSSTMDEGSGDSLMPFSTSDTSSLMVASTVSSQPPTQTPHNSTDIDSTSTLSPPQTPVPVIWVGVGVAAAVMLVLLGVTVILLVCVLHKLLGGRKKKSPLRKTSSASGKKLIECALQEITETRETGSEECLFEHLTTATLSSFPASSLPSYVEQLHDEDGYLAEEEYEDVKTLDPPASCDQAKLSCNEFRNRYTNILPRDSTRVVLSTIPKVAGSDYINANFIDGFTHSREYIATQGPLPSTCADFWRMVWEYNVHIIVMVTNVEENGMVKCHRYWPSGGMVQYGNTSITLESEVFYPEFVRRELTLTVNFKNKKISQVGVAKTVTQYHFTSWPDFGVPREASAMIKFVRRVRNAVSPGHGPIVTHCSAGVGRTGTYIAVDMLTQQLDKDGPVAVQEVVCKMRAQRGSMVQTAAQYLFIYDSILYYHSFGRMEVSAGSLGARVEALDTPTEEGSTPLDKEFQHVITAPMSHDSLFSVALNDDNADKNRDSNNIPLDTNRVVLEDLSSGEDYINASFITGYYNRIEFIATQHPLPSTSADFWSMVWERDVRTIVTIGPVADTQDCYWPTESSEPRSFDNGVTVKLVESEWVEGAGLTVREMSVHSVKNTKEALPVLQFHLQSWPVGGPPTETTPIIELIERSREHWRETGFNLIAVHTAAGVGCEAAGVYCGLCVLFRQLDVEDFMDVFSTVRKLRKQRPAVFTSKDHYRFMYMVLESHQKEQ